MALQFKSCTQKTGKISEDWGLVNSRTIFIAMLRLYGTRGGTKIWAKIISACAKKCSIAMKIVLLTTLIIMGKAFRCAWFVEYFDPLLQFIETTIL